MKSIQEVFEELKEEIKKIIVSNESSIVDLSVEERDYIIVCQAIDRKVVELEKGIEGMLKRISKQHEYCEECMRGGCVKSLIGGQKEE
jgi:hypothetical protein